MSYLPIIKSILDNDLYTLTVGQVAFKHFPNARVQYQFINRGKTKFPKGFAEELTRQVNYMSLLSLAEDEAEWVSTRGYFCKEYVDYLREYRFNPSELTIVQEGEDLSVLFDGTWVSSIMWEVPFLALVSELYYKMTGKTPDADWQVRMENKAKNLSTNGCLWMEFGTRRRLSFDVQETVVKAMQRYTGFMGTSNMLLAYRHALTCLGTMSHQGPMAMQALYGATLANKKWREHWIETYGSLLAVFLPDTFTTDVFLRDFTREEAMRWQLRQDSGSPDVWLQKILAFYKANDVDSTQKTAVLSDSLDDVKFVDYTLRYRDLIKIVGGIGTNFTNDCGHTPLSIVIKLVAADFGKGMVDVVKLSDSTGKYTGKPEAVTRTKEELALP